MSFVAQTEFLLEVAKGNIPGTSTSFLQAANQAVGTIGEEQTFWNMAAVYQYLTADTQLYASSSSASDTAVTIIVSGLDDTYTEVVRTVTLNGQAQVALSGLMFRTFRCATIGGTEPLGDVYIAESDTLTAGVPDTQAKIQMKMLAGSNTSGNGTFTVPADKTLFLYSTTTRSGKEEALRIITNVRPLGGVFAQTVDLETFEAQDTSIGAFLGVASKTDIHMTMIPAITNVRSIYFLVFLLVDNDQVASASMM